MRQRPVFLVAVPLVVLLIAAPVAAGKAGLTARMFLSLTATGQEIYVAGITDALDAAGMLKCPPGTSYDQVITLTSA